MQRTRADPPSKALNNEAVAQWMRSFCLPGVAVTIALLGGGFLAGANRARWALWVWLLGVCAYPLLFRGRASGQRQPAWVWPTLCLLIFAAAALRLFRIYEFPGTISVDELLPGLESLRLSRATVAEVFTRLGWFSMPNLAFALAGWSMNIVPGPPFWTLRLVSAVEGTVAVAATTLLGLRLFGAFGGLSSGCLLAASYWHLHNSRTGFTYAQSSFATALILYLLVRGLQSRNLRCLALAGTLCGFCLELYFPVRILLVLVPLCFVLEPSGSWLERLGHLCIFAVGSAVVLFPLVAAVGLESLLAHSYGSTILRPETLRVLEQRYQVHGIVSVLWVHAQEFVAMFGQWADLAVHNHSPGGLLGWSQLILFVLGCLLAVATGHRHALFLLLWFLLTAFLGVMMGNFPRASYRLAPALPAICLLGGFALESLLRMPAFSSSRYLPVARAALVAGVLVVATVENVLLFFRYLRADGLGYPMAAAARFASRDCDGRTYYVGVPDPLVFTPEIMALFCPQYRTADNGSFPPEISASEKIERVVFLVVAEADHWVARIREYYPSARVHLRGEGFGARSFVSVDVSAAELRSVAPVCSAQRL